MSISEAKAKRRPKYKCAHCCKNFATGKCPLCRKQYYCKRECQKVDWENHKLYCLGFNADDPPSTVKDKDLPKRVVANTSRVNNETEVTVSNVAVTSKRKDQRPSTVTTSITKHKDSKRPLSIPNATVSTSTSTTKQKDQKRPHAATVSNVTVTTPITTHKAQKRTSTVHHRNSIERKRDASPTDELIISPAPACSKRKLSSSRPSSSGCPTGKKPKTSVLPRVVEKGPGIRTINDAIAIAATTKPTNPAHPKKGVRTKTYMRKIVNTVRNQNQTQIQFVRIIAQKKSDEGLMMYLLEPHGGKPDSDYTWMCESQVNQKYRSLLVTWKEECPNSFNVVSTRALQIHPLVDDRKFCNFCDRYGGKLLKCSRNKSHQAHQKCLFYTDEQFAAAFEWKWQCPECLSCGICKGDNNPETILCCDRCGRGRHSACVKMKTMPKEEEDWFCFGCEQTLKKRKSDKNLKESTS
eukprot:m.195818 g.195818  ORF g.195818 m.195818 type:complete len:466 (-) comp32587_c0_seq1:108-1505(-)